MQMAHFLELRTPWKQCCIALLLSISYFFTCANFAIAQKDNRSPMTIASSIADKLVKETPFKYKLSLSLPTNQFDGLQVIDFGRTYQLGKPLLAYAYTELFAKDPMDFNLNLEHNNGCKIWLNGQLVYSKEDNGTIKLTYEERSLELKHSVILKLKKGANALLVKSSTLGKEWKCYFQPPSQKGAILQKQIAYPEIGLKHMGLVDNNVASLSNWIVMGPFENKLQNNKAKGLEIPFAPESGISFGQVYQGANGPVTWSLPKIDVLGNLIDNKEWGTNYTWNYHNGGVAWAMQQLGELSGNLQYKQYADNFCDFHLQGKPFVEYQVNNLNAFNSANSLFINTPLLDFTLAPALPFIYRLRKDASNFSEKKSYQEFIQSMMHYASKEQIRFPGSGIYTRTTPIKYTTWVDDMFMGIPFLVQASMYASDKNQQKLFLDDAANQVIGFNQQVFDASANLYVHAKYSNSDEKLPHWSRANGWGIWATTEVLMQLPSSDARYQTILRNYQNHAKALLALQDQSGFWLNVLDVKNSPKEVSGTAIFMMAFARGIRMGWLDKQTYLPAIMKGWEALKSQVEKDGTVHNICMGTMCSTDVNYYITRPFYDNDTHGLFAVLFACMELEKLMKQ